MLPGAPAFPSGSPAGEQVRYFPPRRLGLVLVRTRRARPGHRLIRELSGDRSRRPLSLGNRSASLMPLPPAGRRTVLFGHQTWPGPTASIPGAGRSRALAPLRMVSIHRPGARSPRTASCAKHVVVPDPARSGTTPADLPLMALVRWLARVPWGMPDRCRGARREAGPSIVR